MIQSHNDSQLRGLQSREHFFDRILLGVCSLALIVVIILLISDFSLFHKAANLKAETVARIADTRNSVRRRATGLPVWSKAAKGEAIQDRDQVFTDADSSTVIRFIDGSEVQLSENTLVTVQKQETRTQFNVVRGALAARSGTGDVEIEIDVGGLKTTVQDKNTEINVTRDAAGETSIAVVGGKAELSSNGKVVELAADTVSQFNQSGTLTGTRKIPVRLLRPENNALLFFQKSQVLQGPRQEFSWEPVKGISDFEVQVAADLGFKNIISKKAVKANNVVLPLKAGVYFWRVGARDPISGQLSFSVERRVVWEEDRAPKLWKPEASARVAFKELLETDSNARAIASVQGGVDGTKVPLFWEAVSGVKAYSIQLATDPDFEDILFEENTARSNVVSNKLKEGGYYWRVRNVDPARPSSPWSAPRAFTVQRIPLPGIPAGLTPESGSELFLSPDLPQVMFNWERSAIAHTYFLEVAKDKDFESLVFSQKVRGSQLRWTPPEVGEFHWRVRVWDEFGRGTPYTERRALEVEVRPVRLALPESEKAVTLVEQKVPLGFRWSKSPLVERYVVQIATDRRFRDNVTELETKREAADWDTFAVGNYYWRVKAYVRGKPDPIESEIRQLEIIDIPLPEPPKLSPEIELEVDASFDPPDRIRHSWLGWILPEAIAEATKARTQNARVKWGTVKGAIAYELELARDEAFESIVTKQRVKVPYYEWKGASPGKYYMRVATVDQYNRSGRFSNTSVVLVRPNPPDLVAPVGSLRVTKADEAISFRWDAVENTLRYEFQLAQDGGFSKIVKQETSQSENLSLFLTDSGTYFWRVRALGPDDLDTHFSEPKTFSYTYAPVAPDAQAPLPTTLRWKPIAKANSYQIQLFNDRRLSKPFLSKTLKENEIVVPLQSGTYFWRVATAPKKGKKPRWGRAHRVVVASPNAVARGPDRSAASVGAPSLEASASAPKDRFVFILSGGYAPSINNYNQQSTDPTLFFSGLNFLSLQGEVEFWYRPLSLGLGLLYAQNQRPLFGTATQPRLNPVRHEGWVGAQFRWQPLPRVHQFSTVWRFGYQYKNLPTFQTATSTTLRLVNSDVHYLKGSLELEWRPVPALQLSVRGWYAQPMRNNNILLSSTLNLRFDFRAKYAISRILFADASYSYDLNRFSYTDDGDLLTGGRVTGTVRDDNQMIRLGMGVMLNF